jgi:hypothetical protein
MNNNEDNSTTKLYLLNHEIQNEISTTVDKKREEYRIQPWRRQPPAATIVGVI